MRMLAELRIRRPQALAQFPLLQELGKVGSLSAVFVVNGAGAEGEGW